MQTYSLDIAYNGANFNGFAFQPGQPTVQGELERALSTIFRTDVGITCAGRTDAGVHAKGQVVSFDVDDEAMAGRTERNFLRSVNALTHDDIAASNLVLRPAGFSARFDAVAREYRYFIYSNPTPSLFMRDFSWHVTCPLDDSALDGMRKASAYLIGEHDFKSFCMAASAQGRRTYRCVNDIEIGRTGVLGDELVVVTIKGNAFLHSMVRSIVGTLMMVGRGKRPPEWVGDVLSARDRKAAGENAPAMGLVLWRVTY